MAHIIQSNKIRAGSATMSGGNMPDSISSSLVVSGWGQEVTNSGTITGPAPLTVFFDASATSSPNYQAFREAGYHFDFGYATPSTPGTWTYSGKPKGNQIGGPIAAHVYETPGTYTASLRAQLPSGTYQDRSVTIVVEDPETYWTTGGRSTTTLTRSSTSAWPTWANNTRYLLQAGQDYSALGRINILNKQTVCVAKTGSGSNPIVGDLAIDRNTSASAPTTGAKIQFINLTAGFVESNLCGSDGLFYKCSATDLKVGTLIVNRYNAYPAQTWSRPRRMCFYECAFDCGSANYPFITQSYQIMVLGCTSVNPTEHSLRIQGGQYGFIAHNKLYDAGNSKHYLTLRATGIQDLSAVVSSSTNTSPASRYIVAADNLLGDATDTSLVAWPCYIGPQDSGSNESLEFILSERNIFAAGAVHTTSVFTAIRGCRKITVRDEVYGDGSTVGVSFGENFGVVDAAWKNGPAYSNKFMGTDPDGVYSFSTPTGILPSKAGS